MWIKAIGLNPAFDDAGIANFQQSFQKSREDLWVLGCDHQRSHIITLAFCSHSMIGFQKPIWFAKCELHERFCRPGNSTLHHLCLLAAVYDESFHIDDVIHLVCSSREDCLHQSHHAAFHVTGGQHEVQGDEHRFFANVDKWQHWDQERFRDCRVIWRKCLR